MGQNKLDGVIPPALDKKDQAAPTKTYKKANGEEITITPEDFKRIVDIFDYLRKIRDSQNARVDALEPDTCTHSTSNHVNVKGLAG